MKKTILFALLLLMSTPLLYAQKLNIGIYLSPTTSWLRTDGNTVKGNGSRIGFDYGFMFETTIGNSERYLFSTGLHVSHRGGKLSYRDTLELDSKRGTVYPNTSLATYRLQYLEVPLNLRLRATEVGKLIPFAQFGFNPGLRIGAKGDVTPPPMSRVPALEREKVLKDATLLSFGLVVGGGVEYKLTEETRVMGSLLLYNGFMNTIDNRRPTDNKIKPNTIALRIGVFF